MLDTNKMEKRILLIDPVDTDRKILTHFLKGYGYQVETGKGLVDAIKKISEDVFVCLILDVDLPEMKGYEAVSLLRTIDPDIKIIMTAKKKHQKARSQSAGAGHLFLLHQIIRQGRTLIGHQQCL